MEYAYTGKTAKGSEFTVATRGDTPGGWALSVPALKIQSAIAETATTPDGTPALRTERKYRVGKTSQRVAIPITPELREWMDTADAPRQTADAQRRAELDAKSQAERAALREGRTPITVSYSDGEYLSGYTAYGDAGQLLTKIGLAREVSGWGTLVDRALVEALGETFTFPQAQAFAQPALDAKAAKKQAAADAQAAVFAAAKASGQRQELSRYTQECDEPDCSLDIMIRYAMPDGTVHTERIHTH